jgi:hypothetical protein
MSSARGSPSEGIRLSDVSSGTESAHPSRWAMARRERAALDAPARREAGGRATEWLGHSGRHLQRRPSRANPLVRNSRLSRGRAIRCGSRRVMRLWASDPGPLSGGSRGGSRPQLACPVELEYPPAHCPALKPRRRGRGLPGAAATPRAVGMLSPSCRSCGDWARDAVSSPAGKGRRPRGPRK